ncbi:MAG: IS4 family transposase, partial [Phototrophicales bacterium]
YTNNDIRFVTRLKKNARTRVVERFKSDSDNVISDDLVQFTGFYALQDYPHKIRKICYRDSETGKILVFLTNELKLDAQTVADIYKARWEIELFFKTVKQNLKIKRFFGNSQNAVWTQIWIAMI